MRIASLSPAITEILFALGQEENIVCTDQFSDFPEGTKDIVHLRDHQNISIEDLRAQEADLILTSTVIQEDLMNLLRQGFEGQSMSVAHFDPRTLNGIYECIRNLGVMLECEKEASDLVKKMQEGFNDVKKKAGLLPRRLKLYVEEWPNPPFASGNWVPEIVRMAGGDQMQIAKPGELSPEVTFEQVQDWSPDLIVLSWCGAGTSVDAKSLFLEREGWENLVDENNIFVIDDSLLNRHGPRLVEGCQRLYGWMFELLH